MKQRNALAVNVLFLQVLDLDWRQAKKLKDFNYQNLCVCDPNLKARKVPVTLNIKIIGIMNMPWR